MNTTRNKSNLATSSSFPLTVVVHIPGRFFLLLFTCHSTKIQRNDKVALKPNAMTESEEKCSVAMHLSCLPFVLPHHCKHRYDIAAPLALLRHPPTRSSQQTRNDPNGACIATHGTTSHSAVVLLCHAVPCCFERAETVSGVTTEPIRTDPTRAGGRGSYAANP